MNEKIIISLVKQTTRRIKISKSLKILKTVNLTASQIIIFPSIPQVAKN